MDTSKIEKVAMSEIERKIYDLVFKYGENEELKGELVDLIEVVKKEQRRIDEVKALAYELASKF